MGSTTGAEYAEFQHRVRRTVYIDNLSPLVTESVMRTALGQFGTVNSVQFIPNFLGPKDLPTCALVEMADAKEARAVVSELSQLPFMIVGMPRPVRTRFAEPEMFGDNPPTPGRNIECRWLDQNDPNFETVTKLKKLVDMKSVGILHNFGSSTLRWNDLDPRLALCCEPWSWLSLTRSNNEHENLDLKRGFDK